MSTIYRKKTIPKSLRNRVWENTFGENFSGNCYICKKRITVHDWHCGHKVSEARGGQTILENLVPLCSTCNLSCGTKNVDEIRKQFQSQQPFCLIL